MARTPGGRCAWRAHPEACVHGAHTRRRVCMARTSAQAGENPSPLKNVPRIDGEAPRSAPWAFWRELSGRRRETRQNAK